MVFSQIPIKHDHRLSQKNTAPGGLMTFNTIELTPRIGTEIQTDVDTLVSGKISGEIRELLEKRGVIAFRQLNLTDEQQVTFTRTLGNIVDARQGTVTKITMDPTENDRAGYLRGAFFWHIDGTMQKVPILASIMSGRRLSPIGGETEFCNTYAAYDDLPEKDKVEYDKIRVVHALESTQRCVYPEPSLEMLQGWQRYEDHELPLVWKHRSGRKSLVIGATTSHIVGMSRRESALLLCRLREWATQPQFVYQHKWTVGDLIIWDNTGTMHRALSYPLDSGRMMHRTTLQGEESFA
jgi:alpha-ketoglutarate-dependent taurine dioxygenase